MHSHNFLKLSVNLYPFRNFTSLIARRMVVYKIIHISSKYLINFPALLFGRPQNDLRVFCIARLARRSHNDRASATHPRARQSEYLVAVAVQLLQLRPEGVLRERLLRRRPRVVLGSEVVVGIQVLHVTLFLPLFLICGASDVALEDRLVGQPQRGDRRPMRRQGESLRAIVKPCEFSARLSEFIGFRFQYSPSGNRTLFNQHISI